MKEGYPEGWLHCTLHLNPKTGEMHSDGDHAVRGWIQALVSVCQQNLAALQNVLKTEGLPSSQGKEG